MKNVFSVFLAMLLVLSCKSQKKVNNPESKKEVLINISDIGKTITSEELKEMLYTYASDDFEGRETGETGHEKAVNYIKDFYTAGSIAPLQDNGDYFQEVKFKQLYVPEINVQINESQLINYNEIISLTPEIETIINTNEILYIGYGIDTDSYSDFENIDVSGKVILAKSGEPKNTDGTYVVSGTTEKSKWSNGRQGRRSKRDAAIKNGAKAFLFVDDMALRYYGAFYKRRAESNGSIGLSLDDGKNSENSMLFMLTTESVINAIDADVLTTDNPKLIGATIVINQNSTSKTIISNNVAGVIRGAEFPNEYIIISAHSDHVGVDENGEVYNGADDDGSGSVAILEIAEAFQIASNKGLRPKRSIIYLHVTGEEKGLLGSQYYTDINPLVPLENTVANLNIDMIGRIDTKHEEKGERNYLYLIGSDKISTELHTLSEEVNQKYTNIIFDYTYNDENDPNRFYYRSDHYNFAKNNIPIIFYFNGTHADYHQIGDTPDKIEYDLLENRTRLVFYTAWELANRNERIKVDNEIK